MKLFCSEELVDGQYPPLLSYIEALPSSYDISGEDITMNLSGDGSLFQSPAATARAFMATGKEECLGYLESLVRRCADGGQTAQFYLNLALPIFWINDLSRLCFIFASKIC